MGRSCLSKPETSLKSSLADQKNNNNIYGFKSDRVDELLPLYDTEFDHEKRVEIIQEIDSIVVESRYSALGLSREPPIRLSSGISFLIPIICFLNMVEEWKIFFTTGGLMMKKQKNLKMLWI